MSKISKKKLLVYPLTLVTFAAGIASCGDPKPTSTPISDDPTSSTDSSSTPTSSVAATVTGVTITGGDTVSAQAPLTLTATVEGTVSDKSVTWTSSNTSIVTVSSAGVVSVVGVVSADTAVVITATSVADPTKSATKAVNVTASVIVVNSTQTSITIKDREVEGYDYKQYFTITVDGEPVDVTDAMIDAGDVEKTPNTYTVTCTYGGRTKAIAVTVSETIYEVSSSVDSVQLKVMEVENYDFESLFTITMDGVEQEITLDMISSTVTAAVGDYSYTVEYNGSSKTITVKVVEDHIIEAIPAYTTYSILSGAVEYFDPTELFTLIVDGEPKQVEASMVNASAVTSTVGEYTVTFSYTEDSTTATASVIVNVVANPSLVVTGKNVTIYPGSDPVSLSSLFTATIDGEEVEVPEDTIEGYIDYSKLGTNTLTFTVYDPFSDGEITATATVTIKTGAHLDYAKSNTIIIQKGTDASKYAFANDAILISNGHSYGIDNRYVDASQVNFAVAGTYPVTITIPYTEVAGATEDITLTINYVVQDKVSSIVVKESSITSDVALTDAEIIDNLTVVVDGKTQTLYTDKAEVINSLTTYVVIDKSAVDVAVPGTYQISVEVYVDGPDSTTPVVVTFDVVVPSNVVISVKPGASTTVVEGTAVRPATLFNIVEGSTPVEVTNDMVSGKVDVFEPGVYGVTVTYKGVSQTVDVVVVSKDIFGSFSTNLVGSTKAESNDDSEDVTTTTSYFRDKFVINEDLTGSIGSTEITEVQGVDAYSLTFKINSFTYKYTYDRGIAVLIPLNTTKMSYTDGMRYYMFAKDSIYTITGRMVINTGSSHIIGSSSTCTSIDIFELTMVEGGGVVHYGLRSELLEVGPNSSYYYEHTLSQVTFSEGFRQASGESGTIYMNNGSYSMNFTMTDASTGKMDRADDGYAKNYEGVYTGTVDGKEATLTINAYNGLDLVVNGKRVANPSGPDIKGLLNGGYDYENDIITIYKYNITTEDGKILYEHYSYRIHLDTTGNTFTVDEKDGYQGLYKAADGSTVFIDGYGSGFFQGISDTSHFTTRAAFDYEIVDGMLRTTFENLKPTYAYGSFADFYVDNFTNELVLANSDVSSLVGNKYSALSVEKGVQVTVSNYTVNIMEDEQDAIDQLLSYFTIVNADGEVTGDAKKAMIDYSLVDFNNKGFYLVTVTAKIDGVDVLKYYTFETVAPLYDGNVLVGEYNTTFNNIRKLTIDRFGNLTYVRNSSSTYTGKVTINDDYTFTCVATNTKNSSERVTISGRMLVNGAVTFTSTGATSSTTDSTEYVYSLVGSSSYSGIGKNILRSYHVGDEWYYLYGSEDDEAATYAAATVTLLNGKNANEVGAVVHIVCGETDIVGKILANHLYSGMVLSGTDRGTYTSTGLDSIVLDGFGFNSSDMGEAKIGDVDYTYYMVNSNVAALVANDKSVTYYDLDTENHTYTVRTNSYADVAGAYGDVTYSSVSSSTSNNNYFSVNDYGIGSYCYSSSSYSSSTYTGAITIDGEGVITFNGKTGTGTSTKYIRVKITPLGNGVYNTSGVTISNSGSETNMSADYIAPTPVKSVVYAASSSTNYVSCYKYDDGEIYLFYTGSSAAPQVATVTSLNDIAYGTAGSIFSVTLDATGTTVIEKAMYTGNSNSAKIGYILPDALAGVYTLSGSDSLELDGFANMNANTKGVAKLGSNSGTYEIISSDTIRATFDGTPVVITIDTTGKTYTVVDEGSYAGGLLGAYKNAADASSISIDSYGIITYTAKGGTVYIGTVPGDATDDTLSVTLNEVGYASGGTRSLAIEKLADGVVSAKIGSDYYFFVDASYIVSEYAKVSSSAHIIYKISKDGVDSYLYAPTSSKTVASIATVVATSDSVGELGAVGSIFELSAGDTVIVAKFTAAGTIALANMDERKSYTGTDGTTLFTDGFTTSATARGKATIGVNTYTYYYNPNYKNTIALYTDSEVSMYCVYASDTYQQAPVIFDEQSVFAAGTYTPVSGTNECEIDQYGYGKIGSYQGQFTLKDANTIEFTGKSSYGYSTTCTITYVAEGIVLLQGTENGYYYQKSNNAKDVWAGNSWKNIVYQITNYKGNVIYVLTSENGSSKSYFRGVVSVEVINDIAFGTAGSIFTVTCPDGVYLYGDKTSTFTAKYVREHGSDGYTLSDAYVGTYTCEGKDDIVLDGFGNVTIGSSTGTYTVSAGTDVFVVVTLDGSSSSDTYKIDLGTMTYSSSQSDVLIGITFSANYTFSSRYDATTSFTFDGFGGVKIVSSSSDYDQNSPTGYYSSDSPLYNKTGTYSIDGTTVTIVVGSYTFVFTLDDAAEPTQMTCTSSTMSTSGVGYFKPTTVFK